MADDFAQNFQVGANLVVQGWNHQERIQQLRSQEAMRQMQERQYAAQADMLTQHAELYRQQSARTKEQEERDAALIVAGQKWHDQDLKDSNGDEDAAMEKTLTRMMFASPSAAQKLGSAYLSIKKAGHLGEDSQFTPTIETPTNPLTGEKIPVLRTGPKTSQMVEGKEGPDLVGIESKRLKAALASGDQELAAFHKGRLLKLTQSTGTTIKTNPDGTVEIVQGGPVGGPDALTKANQTKVQDAQAQSLATIDIANRLEPLIDDETVGVKSFTESWIKDRVLSQAFPELVNQKRATAEQLAAQLRASAVKELRSDGNITEGERKQILSGIPQINDPVDSPARAKTLLQGIRKMAAVRAMVSAKRMGGQVPKSAALALDDEALAGLVNQGLITPEQAVQAYRMKRQ